MVHKTVLEGSGLSGYYITDSTFVILLWPHKSKKIKINYVLRIYNILHNKSKFNCLKKNIYIYFHNILKTEKNTENSNFPQSISHNTHILQLLSPMKQLTIIME